MKKLKVSLLLLAAALMCVVAAGGAPLPPGDANTIVSWSGALPTDMVFYDKTGQEYYYWQPDGTRTTYTPPATMTCILAGGESYSCDILWESPDLLPADGTVQKLGGTLTPGDGFNIAEEVQPPAFSVFATAQDMPTQQLAAFYIELPRTGGVTDVGISVTPPDDLPKTAICELSGAAASFYLPIEWVWDSIDFNAAGLYYVSCHPKNLPDCFTLSLSLPSYLFCVMDPGFIDLSYCAGTDFIGNPLFRWSWDAADVSEIRLFRKTGVTGIWEEHSVNFRSYSRPTCFLVKRPQPFTPTQVLLFLRRILTLIACTSIRCNMGTVFPMYCRSLRHQTVRSPTCLGVTAALPIVAISFYRDWGSPLLRFRRKMLRGILLCPKMSPSMNG